MKDLFKLANNFFFFPLMLLFFSCASSPGNSGKPAWVDSVDSVYSRSQFIAAVGHATDREMAERNAIANLAAFFGQSIQADQIIVNTYLEAVRDGITIGWVDNIAMQNTIRTSVSMDNLIGAEIKDVWQDTRHNIFYAVAVMERAKTIRLYTDMILANLEMIRNLTTMSQAERNSLEGFSRFQFAATVADINITYANLLNMLGARTPAGVRRGDEYRLEARNITRAIPVNIVVNNDRAGRIQDAFAKTFTDFGFRSGGSNSRYALRVNVWLSPVDFPDNPHRFILMELSANLTDTVTREVLLPFTFNIREGHPTVAGAENRVFVSAEQKIEKEYKDILSTYLSQLLPKR
ncbi:MAG: LPP20 family lipoprotein [Spirochaetaceae bacterium]|nr:LPP20 family lipoprotein [Spirochaetaceae bacterium]